MCVFRVLDLCAFRPSINSSSEKRIPKVSEEMGLFFLVFVPKIVYFSSCKLSRA